MSSPEYFDRLVQLRTVKETPTNAAGEMVPQTEMHLAYAKRVGVSRAAEFAAQTEGYKPECAYRLWTRDYHDEELLVDDNAVYRIRRAYSRDGKTELTVSKGVR